MSLPAACGEVVSPPGKGMGVRERDEGPGEVRKSPEGPWGVRGETTSPSTESILGVFDDRRSDNRCSGIPETRSSDSGERSDSRSDSSCCAESNGEPGDSDFPENPIAVSRLSLSLISCMLRPGSPAAWASPGECASPGDPKWSPGDSESPTDPKCSCARTLVRTAAVGSSLARFAAVAKSVAVASPAGASAFAASRSPS
mmetsp:Transcript_9445/g.23854  ORF Transcript_9445/g.23854 Transcript_9445/m.23854 type:complete len:200 (+) Transcript_9445:175-774(+)